MLLLEDFFSDILVGEGGCDVVSIGDAIGA